MPLSLQHYSDAGEVVLYFARRQWSEREVRQFTGVHSKDPLSHPEAPDLVACATEADGLWIAVIYRQREKCSR